METRIDDSVKQRTATHIVETIFGEQAAELSFENDAGFSLFRLVDEEFAAERLEQAKEHYREFGTLPDKGQFPYCELTDGQIVFEGTEAMFSEEELDEKVVRELDD